MDEDVRFAEMISKMAHELRSPLTSVKGFSSTLLLHWDRFEDDQRLEFIEAIHGDAERMARIVREVLDLARWTAGRLELDVTPVDIAAISEEEAQELAKREGGERIIVDVPEGLSVQADHERISYIVSNLMENGVKFSEEGPVQVTAERTPAGDIVLSVADQGIGIEEERLPDLFSGPGPRGQMATPRGSGLGLYLARRIVEAHGGSLSVESEEGKGSVFKLQLPGAPA